MKIYNCDVCGELIYFENTQCTNCGSTLGYLPDIDNMSSLEFQDGISFQALAPSAENRIYKKCQNYHMENVCNWMIPSDDPHAFCVSCRLNEMIPNLSVGKNREYWHRLEIAKRRLIYSLLRIGLPIKTKAEDPEHGLAFIFFSDEVDPFLPQTEKRMTGHKQGKISINIREADDAVREKVRLDMNERYRTLLGHFRHEIGHYYWFLLIGRFPKMLASFRDLFGNEQEDYKKALKNYYAQGPAANWPQQYVSGYASAHPWEDWAESWAHFLHMFDTLETARAWGLTVSFQKKDLLQSIPLDRPIQSFEEMRNLWIYLSSALNSLNRSMGMRDVYPFVWTETVIEKLRYIQQVIISQTKEGEQ